MITPVQLSYIFALLKHKNFQRAAESCHVTQPTLSMQLKKVEEDFGYQIFNRDTSPISLTTEGERLYPYLVNLQESLNLLEIEVQKLNGTYKSEVRIGIIPTVSSYLVPELFIKWKSEIGDIHLDIKELTTENLITAVNEKEIDLGIMAGPIESSSFNQQILYNEEILLYTSSINKESIQLEELENITPWLLGPGNCLRTQMINFCNLKETGTSKWNYEGGNMHLLTQMVEQEGGYTLVPAYEVPYLNLKPEMLKSIKDYIPIRQIIGIFLKRNTKQEEITNIMRVIQRTKNTKIVDSEKVELLPWKV